MGTHGIPLRRPFSAPSWREPFYQNLSGPTDRGELLTFSGPTFNRQGRPMELGSPARPNSSASNKPSRERASSAFGAHPAINQVLRPEGSPIRTKELGYFKQRDQDWRQTHLGQFRRSTRGFDGDRVHGFHYGLPPYSLESNMYGSWHHAPIKPMSRMNY